MEMPKNPPQLRIITEVSERGMTTRDKYTGEFSQLHIRDRTERTRRGKIKVTLQLAHKVVVALLRIPVSKVSGKSRLGERIYIWTFASWRSKLWKIIF